MAETKEKPILFSGAMVRAILEGRKTQTRRVVTPSPDVARHWKEWTPERIDQWIRMCPYGKPGDRLWVRETFARCACDVCRKIWPAKTPHGILGYQATYGGPSAMVFKPSIHMPRWASRLTLEITEVRVQRVQKISEADSLAEGIYAYDGQAKGCYGVMGMDCRTMSGVSAKDCYRHLWDSINSYRGFGWEKNPWVWCITFKRAEAR